MSSADRRDRRYRATRAVTWFGALVNGALAIMQIAAGWLFHSAALIADGIHTLSDLLSDGVVLVASRQARAAPDALHPYGHGRFETLATTIVALLLLGAASWIAFEAGQRLLAAEDVASLSRWVLVFAVITVVAKEGLYRITRAVARRVDSSLLHANAWHHRSDAASSLVVLVGLTFATFGLPMMDALAALAVAGFIVWVAVRMLWVETRKLIDTGLEADEIAALVETASRVADVRGVHDLRTRWIGDEIAIDLHVQVAPEISVSEGHAIGNRVAHAIRTGHPRITDVTVHVDTQPDHAPDTAPTETIVLWPERGTFEQWLSGAWSGLDDPPVVDDLTLHFFRDHVRLSVTLTLGATVRARNAPETGAGGATWVALREREAVLLACLKTHARAHSPPGGRFPEVVFRYRLDCKHPEPTRLDAAR